jgi:hypothetical protein
VGGFFGNTESVLFALVNSVFKRFTSRKLGGF